MTSSSVENAAAGQLAVSWVLARVVALHESWGNADTASLEPVAMWEQLDLVLHGALKAESAGGVEKPVTAPLVACERYDHQEGVVWPAMRGRRFSDDDDRYVVYVSDRGHVDLHEASVGGEYAAGSLARAETLLAVLSAAVQAAREAAAAYDQSAVLS